VTGHRDYVIKALLHGVTGPVDGRNYAEIMLPMGSSRDEWIADVASYVRTSFGNSGSVVGSADVTRVRADTAGRAEPWTVSALEASLPISLVPDGRWTISSSHASETASNAFTLAGWSTGAPQQPGMWFLVELPAPSLLTEIQFTSPPQGGGRSGPPPLPTHPRDYRVEVSLDGAVWTTARTDTRTVANVTTTTFEPASARFVRLTLASGAADTPAWAMQRLRIYRTAARQ
jgi:hypothetical protein